MRSAVTVLEAAASHDLTTVATFKETLKIKPADKSRDAALLRCIRQATGAINRACGRPFGYEKVSERFLFGPCETADMLVLNRRPVIAPIESITEGTAVLAVDKYDLFDPVHGLLMRSAPPWVATWAGGQLTVVYSGGFVLLDSLPDEIELACLKLATDYYRSEGRDTTVQSVNVPDVDAVTYAAGGDVATAGPLPDEVRGLLRPYLKVI